jgi:hypothetical protein
MKGKGYKHFCRVCAVLLRLGASGMCDYGSSAARVVLLGSAGRVVWKKKAAYP